MSDLTGITDFVLGTSHVFGSRPFGHVSTVLSQTQSYLLIYPDPSQALLLGVISLGPLALSLRAVRRRRIISDNPTSKTAGVFIGFVELAGIAQTSAPLICPLSNTACVYYSWSVEEAWQRVTIEKYTENGKEKTREKVETGWSTVGGGQASIPFYLADELGSVLVRPDKAELTTAATFFSECSASDLLYYSKGPARAITDSTGQRRFSERAIPLDASLYVAGHARERDDMVAPEIAYDPDAPLFMISVKPKQRVLRGLTIQLWAWGLTGLLLAASVWNTTTLWLPVILYASTFMLFWAWTAFNSLNGLRARVQQSAAVVDIQLKRRASLIPNLVEAVKGAKAHEANVLQMLATLQKTDGEAAGTSALRIIAGAYPALLSDLNFEQLRNEMVATEQRLALARNHYTEIASFFNYRVQSFPDKFVCRWLQGIMPVPLGTARVGGDPDVSPLQGNTLCGTDLDVDTGSEEPQYLLLREGTVYGPYTRNNIESMKRDDRLLPEDLVKADGSGEWALCRDQFRELFASPSGSTVGAAHSSRPAPASVSLKVPMFGAFASIAKFERTPFTRSQIAAGAVIAMVIGITIAIWAGMTGSAAGTIVPKTPAEAKDHVPPRIPEASLPPPVTVEPLTTPPSVLSKVDPEYSDEARKAKYSGTVLLSVVVNTLGQAEEISVIKGLGMGLDENAIEAIEKWRFIPAVKNGVLVKAHAQIEVNFRLL